MKFVKDKNGDYKPSDKSYIKSSGFINSELLFENQIWRVRDVASYLGCSIGHIYNLVSKDEIPNTKKGKFLFFVPTEIQNWILEGNYL